MARPKIIGRLVRRSDIAGLAIALGASTLLWAIGAGKELWFDERFVQVLSQRSLSDMFGLLRFENNPPFVFLLSHWWQIVFGSSAVALRTMTLIPTLATLVVTWKFAREIAGKQVAALTAIVVAIMGQVVIQSQELRMYPWLMLWSGLALWIGWRLSHQWRSPDAAWITVIHIVGIYTHYTYFFVAFGIWVWLWLTRPDHRRSLVLSSLLVAGATVPWFFISLWPKLQDLQQNVGIQRIAADRPEALLLPLRFLMPPWFLEGTGWTLVRVAGSLAAVTGLACFTVRTFQLRNRSGVYLALQIGLISLGLVATGIVVPKYATALIVPVAVTLGWGIATLPIGRGARWTLTVALLTASLATSIRQAGLPYVTYRAAAEVIESQEQPGDIILVYPFNDTIAFGPEYRGGLKVRGFFPLRQPDDVGLSEIVRYNFRVSLTEENIHRISEYVGQAPRVWFVYDVPPSAGYWRGDLIANWFTEAGYQANMYQDLFRNVPPLLVRYDKVHP